ncbi:MAG TPA: hypothetical protein VNT26_01400, partial [Candidatus Sulfotelmatobacter sp.]|nr:hypothetical protein [Candidatus Sulfotelmatobacter sp.]
LEAVKGACQTNGLELIPAIFSIGYGGGLFAHNPNLAEGLPVEDADFVVQGAEAQLVSGQVNKLVNGGFEDFSGTKLKAFNFYDQPGEIGFIDTQIKHGGQAALRLENFRANPHGHGRVMQTVEVQPHRCYRMTLWVKTEGLEPAGSFQITVLTDKREVAPRRFKVPATTDWHKVSFLFNSLEERQLKLYAGVWGGKAGKFWLDDWSLEEVGPINVLHRPGTPVSVRNANGQVTYSEGKDYTLQAAPFRPWRDDGEAAQLKILPGSRIQQGEHLRVSWYHSAIVYESQVTACMGEPAVYEIFDHEAKLLAERLHPKRVLLNMDEIRMGGTCRACGGRNMGELLGECVTKQTQILRRHLPNAQVYVWSDMFDPTHNAHGNYYLVNGDFTGSWEHVPKDVVMALWSGEPRERSLRFFEAQGFPMLVACYYDADDLNQVKAWLQLARQRPAVRGFMYTPWEKKYSLLPDFGELLKQAR